ncbi:hypothetical protein [Amycolatopsis sp. FDAARGOS 1241]|uniref:hypothetical protein n=1 Tax=Amycolatopsis sp. FDAARGOS 1241 TaxID=2778070 RepID=UPI00194EF1BD|nr:hypothetical protein [Amycolatopsis sp. FDAARGOS 1241]QRP48536.1 hypothetical protein I6J71_12230 [Amycolatopsis sp. FDAARGOS 1241]
MSTRGTAALRRDVRALARRGLGSAAFRHESAARLAAEVGADAYCFAEIDPDSAMTTGIVSCGVDRAGAPLLYRNEYGQPDFLKLPARVRARTPAASLPAVTGGDPGRSKRYRALIHPAGFGDELRTVVQDGGRVWGFLHLFRRDRARRSTRTRSPSPLKWRARWRWASVTGYSGHRPRRPPPG